ncbi:MAG: helix-hairpin-helix domain-containing protein [Bacteroidetes bacterium]|nr:helix-hairpin-helix domain-containing protein [Bacteroidota bacterium]
MYFYFRPVQHADSSIYKEEIAAFIKEYSERKSASTFFYRQDSSERKGYSQKAAKRIEYFEFDPNKIEVEEWMKLGFSEKQAESIEKYKAHGAKFYKPEDLKRVYIIGEDGYERLAPYIKIASREFQKREYERPEATEQSKSRWTIDINTADSAEFEKLRGIGPSYARRMVNYRKALGGYVSVEQVSEIWGLPDSTYQAIKDKLVVGTPVSKMNINLVSLQKLKAHPYIRYYLAEAIEKYRDKKVNLQSIEELKSVKGMNDSIYQKIAPYFQVGE